MERREPREHRCRPESHDQQSRSRLRPLARIRYEGRYDVSAETAQDRRVVPVTDLKVHFITKVHIRTDSGMDHARADTGERMQHRCHAFDGGVEGYIDRTG